MTDKEPTLHDLSKELLALKFIYEAERDGHPLSFTELAEAMEPYTVPGGMSARHLASFCQDVLEVRMAIYDEWNFAGTRGGIHCREFHVQEWLKPAGENLSKHWQEIITWFRESRGAKA